MPLLFRRVLASLLLISAPLAAGSAVPALWGPAAGVRLAAAAGRAHRQAGALVLHAYALQAPVGERGGGHGHPLLSRRGTVELQPAGNTLVIRDTLRRSPASWRRCANFDHPARPWCWSCCIVRASRTAVSPPMQRSDLPEEMTRRLRCLLPYDIYEVQAQAQLAPQEGQAVTIRWAGLPGELPSRQREAAAAGEALRLPGHPPGRRRARPRPALIHTNLNLWLGQTISLGLARERDQPGSVDDGVDPAPRRGPPRGAG